METGIQGQTAKDLPSDEDFLMCEEAPSFLYPSDEEMIRTFFPSHLEAETLLDEKVAEWKEVARQTRADLKDDLKAILELKDERSKWFWTEALKISPAAKRLKEALAQIARLRRLKDTAKRVFGIKDEPSDKRTSWAKTDLARRVPILNVVSRLIPVTNAGKGHVALCPFHKDTNPSLNIYPDSNRFHCFGCHKGGDAIEFVRLYHKWGFRQAIEYLTEGGNEDERQGNRRRVR